MKTIPVFRQLEDAQLVDEVDRLAQTGRDNTVDLIAALEELDRRQLCLPAGYRSMYAYCTRRLLLGEGAAYACIEAARASRRFPVILDKLADGSITLATIGLIARHLTASNHVSLLEEVRHKSKREVERIVTGLKPKPDVATLIRKMPQPAVATVSSCDQQGLLARVAPEPPTVVIGAKPSDVVTPLLLEAPTTEHYVLSAAPPRPRPVIAALTPERFKLQITMDRETHDTLREIQDLVRHSVPNGDAAVIVARALKVLREQLLRQKAAQVKRPRARRAEVDAQREPVHSSDCGAAVEDFSLQPPSRLIPADVRREVWDRDGGQCAFVGTDGRCTERGFLEFHHVEPFAAGGAVTPATSSFGAVRITAMKRSPSSDPDTQDASGREARRLTQGIAGNFAGTPAVAAIPYP